LSLASVFSPLYCLHRSFFASSLPHSLLFSIIFRGPCSPLFPYTTLFRSTILAREARHVDVPAARHRHGQGDGQGTTFPRRVKHRSEEHTSELQSRFDLVCRLLLEKKK